VKRWATFYILLLSSKNQTDGTVRLILFVTANAGKTDDNNQNITIKEQKEDVEKISSSQNVFSDFPLCCGDIPERRHFP
jgi:hypothetical protein